jgi:hypothetical protein
MQNLSKEDQCIVIQFLGAEDHQPIEINWKMHAVYVNACVSKTTIEWHQKYLSGQQGTSDEAQPGQAWVIAKVEEAAYRLDLSLCYCPLKKVLKGHRFMLDENVNAAVFPAATQGVLWGDPSAGASAGCPSHHPCGLFLTTSTPVHRTVPKWVSFEQVSCNWISNMFQSQCHLQTVQHINVKF